MRPRSLYGACCLPLAALFLAFWAAPTWAGERLPLVHDLAPGLAARELIRSGATLTDGSVFGPKTDLTAYFPTGPDTGYLLVGHEIRWAKDPLGGRFTRLRLAGGQVASSQLWASGMHNNCAGTATPWKTLLTGEEYPHAALYDGPDAARKQRWATTRIKPGDPGADFGWVYEIDPFGETPAGKTVRRDALGRFSHESAAVVGENVVYMTEDYDAGYLYRFTADRKGDLSRGKLYAYDRPNARWVFIADPLNAHLDAKAAGATPFHRLEDLQLGPDGAIYVAETGLLPDDPFGRVLRLDRSTRRLDVALEGDGTHLAQPDNLTFDPAGRMVICEDMFTPNLTQFGPNEVLRWDMKSGAVEHLASIVKGGEPTGPSWLDAHRLVLSIQAGDDSGVVLIENYR